MADNPLDPFHLLNRSQQLALKLAADTLRAIRDTTVTTVTAPEDLVRQVVGLADALTGLAAATAQPLQDFLVRQRELADTMAKLASAQADLALIVADLAERHAATVTALEHLSAPVFAVVGAHPPEAPRKKGARKK
ncbi:hypothetical protein [Nocardioides rubriscoriae]|uniref:hypothetical protein n=1 Tax=Nocardioides rubriscoriae TaxID=642762 RepID=UPI0011DF8B2C|nr:hypothetical protein [Nocardioides rubriscoriae]